MQFAGKLTAAVLAAALLLPGGALAAEAPSAGRQEDLDFLYAALREHHPDLYANTPEAEFEVKKAEIEGRLATRSDAEFALDLQSFVALTGDSHTTTNLGSALGDYRTYPFAADWYGGGWVLSVVDAAHRDLLGQTLVSVGGLDMEELCGRFADLVSADNPVKLRRQVGQTMYVEEILAYLGVVEAGAPLALTVRDAAGRESAFSLTALDMAQLEAAAPDLARLTRQTEKAPATAYDRQRYYFSLPLDEKTYYIQYNRCQEDPNLPMEDFARQVAADLEQGAYSKLLLDLRNNGGGSDGVLVPILMTLPGLVRSGMKVYGLVGETTYSSAIINAVEIQEAGGVLAGSPTSGSVDHFGATGSFVLPNSGIRVTCSSKFIDLGTLLEAGLGAGVEPLTPELPVEQTLADALAGRDTLVEHLLQNGDSFVPAPEPDAPLTRGRLAWLLWQAAGSPAAGPSAFEDLFPIAYYVDAVNWCAREGIVTGGPAGTFEAVRPVTLQEAAVMLARFADSRERAPQAVRTDAPALSAPAAPWAAGGVERLWAWGGISPGADPAGTLTRAQGEALAGLLPAAP